MSWSLKASYTETFQGMGRPVASDLTIAEATRSSITFGVEYEVKTGLSTSEFSWAA